MKDGFVEVGGLPIRYLEEGAGDAVVLLHGASLGSSADVWARNLPDLAARGLRAIAPDLPGFGGSAAPGDASLAYRTAFVPEFLEALGIERACVIGHSQSGRIAVTLAAQAPERFPKIVVVGTASLLPPLPGAPGEAEADEGGEREPTLDETRALLLSQLFDASLATDEAVALRHRMSVGRNFAAHVARQAAKGKKSNAKLDEARVPVRLVYGKQDRAAATRAALFPRGTDVHVLDRCKHLVQWDARSEFARLAGDFLTSR